MYDLLRSHSDQGGALTSRVGQRLDISHARVIGDGADHDSNILLVLAGQVLGEAGDRDGRSSK